MSTCAITAIAKPLHTGEGPVAVMHSKVVILLLTVLFSWPVVCDEVRCILPDYHSPLSSRSKMCSPNSSIRAGVICPFHCDVPAILSGPFALTCGADGNLENPFPSCLSMDMFAKIPVTNAQAGDDAELTCSISQPFEDGDVLYWYKEIEYYLHTLLKKDAEETVSFGTRMYEVRNDIDLFIPNVRTEDAGVFRCTVSKLATHRRYSFNISLAVEDYCHLPQFPPHVRSNSSSCRPDDIVFGNIMCLFYCDTGYWLDGMAALQCLPDGQLSSHLPTCKDVTCTVNAFSTPISNINTECHTGAEVNFGETCTIQCADGYHNNGTPNMTCMSEGNFDVTPSCEANDSSTLGDHLLAIVLPISLVVLLCGAVGTLVWRYIQMKTERRNNTGVYYPVAGLRTTQWKKIATYVHGNMGNNMCSLISNQLKNADRTKQAIIKLQVIAYMNNNIQYKVKSTSGGDDVSYPCDIIEKKWNSKKASSAEAFALYIWLTIQCIRDEKQQMQAQYDVLALRGSSTSVNVEDDCSVYSVNTREEWGTLANQAFGRLLELEHRECPDGDVKRKWVSQIFATIASYKRMEQRSKDSHMTTRSGGSSTTSNTYMVDSFVTTCIISLEEYESEQERAQLRHKILETIYSSIANTQHTKL